MIEKTQDECGLEDAPNYLGRLVLIGLTYCDADGGNIEHVQKSGYIQSVSYDEGIEIELSGSDIGASFWLPPTFEGFIEADEGSYTLTNGDVVDDPDFLVTYTITRAAS